KVLDSLLDAYLAAQAEREHAETTVTLQEIDKELLRLDEEIALKSERLAGIAKPVDDRDLTDPESTRPGPRRRREESTESSVRQVVVGGEGKIRVSRAILTGRRAAMKDEPVIAGKGRISDMSWPRFELSLAETDFEQSKRETERLMSEREAEL